MLAAEHGYKDVAARLIEAEAGNMDLQGWTALMYASKMDTRRSLPC